MKRNALVLLLVLMLAACATMSTSPRDQLLTVETQFTGLVQDYNRWYVNAPADVQERWRAEIDPLFIQADRIIEAAEVLVQLGSPATDQIEELIAVKSRILQELAKDGY